MGQSNISGYVKSDSSEVISFANIYIIKEDTTVMISITNFDGYFNYHGIVNYPFAIYAQSLKCNSDTLVIDSIHNEIFLEIKYDCIERFKYQYSKVEALNILEEEYYVDISDLYSDFPIIKGDSIIRIENYNMANYIQIYPNKNYINNKGESKSGTQSKACT